MPWKRDRRAWNHPWYHNFSPLGQPTTQAAGIFGPNQSAKEKILFPFIDRAISMCPDPVRGLEMFCADGYYSIYALQHGASHMTGVDLGDPQSAGDVMHLRQAAEMASVLGLRGKADFLRQDVFEVRGFFDLTICAGGLYHLLDPESLLRRTRQITGSALVVQTVCSLVDESVDYFQSPAPGWTWGCRFSFEWLLAALRRAGWRVIAADRNILEGNTRPEDRGSAYALCAPD